MRVELPDIIAPAKFLLDASQTMNDEEYFEFCANNQDLRIERTAQGEIVIMPPCGGESDSRNTELVMQLGNWTKRDGRGRAFGPSVEFILPSSAAYSPDASWVSRGRLSKLSKEQLRRFPPVCPEFVVEVMSPSDRLKTAREKMLLWLAEGVELAWLIDADRETVYIYRQGFAAPEILIGITELAGEGAMAGFVLDLTDIWAGL